MQIHHALLTVLGACFLSFQSVQADEPSAFGSGFDVQDFYQPFTLVEITPANMQKWPYYKYTSVHWDRYAVHGVAKIDCSTEPAKLTVAEGDERFDLNTKWKEGRSYIESLQSTQSKGFIVVKDNKILAEFYDNGYNLGDTNLIQSASKTFTAVVIGRLVEKGLIDLQARVDQYMEDFKETGIGSATVQSVLDMTSGLPEMGDYHTPGAPGYLYEIEIGMKPGKPAGHRKNIKSTDAVKRPGEAWYYSDKNTDTLGLLAEQVSGKKFTQLLSELFDDFGAHYDGSIALTSDGTTAPNYGISIALRDYGLFHQWLAHRQGPKCFYAAALDGGKTRIQENAFGSKYSRDTPITYGSQAWYLKEHDILMSYGSYGQVGFSDMKSGVSVAFQQDWGANTEFEKFYATRDLALSVINHLRSHAATPNGR